MSPGINEMETFGVASEKEMNRINSDFFGATNYAYNDKVKEWYVQCDGGDNVCAKSNCTPNQIKRALNFNFKNFGENRKVVSVVPIFKPTMVDGKVDMNSPHFKKKI